MPDHVLPAQTYRQRMLEMPSGDYPKAPRKQFGGGQMIVGQLKICRADRSHTTRNRGGTCDRCLEKGEPDNLPARVGSV